MTTARTTTRSSVYTTTAFSRYERIDGSYARVSAWLVHAKTWGSAKPVCGADSMSGVEKNRCPVCASAAATASRRGAAPTG